MGIAALPLLPGKKTNNFIRQSLENTQDSLLPGGNNRVKKREKTKQASCLSKSAEALHQSPRTSYSLVTKQKKARGKHREAREIMS